PLKHVVRAGGCPRLKPPSQVVRPLLGFMDEGDDFERAVGDAIGGERRRVGDNQFTRAVYAARAPALRVKLELLDGLCEAITDQAGLARAVTGDMAHQLVQVVTRTRREPNPHAPPLPGR